MFGYPSDVKSPELYWGARAIYEAPHFEGRRSERKIPAHIDLLYDRQSFEGHEHPEKDAFVQWVDKTALPALRKWADEKWVMGDSREVFSFEEGSYVLKASPNASYGYLYIGAWKKGGEASGRCDAQTGVSAGRGSVRQGPEGV